MGMIGALNLRANTPDLPVSRPSSKKRHKDAVIAPVLVGNQAQHPAFFHRPGTAEDLIGPTGKDFLPDTAAQLIHEITVDRIG